MPCSLAVAGGCHLLRSVCEDCFEGMAHWEAFWEQLTVLDRLLMVKFRFDRLVGTCCVEGSAD
eukprot:11491380-Alexandrium_andersonii.AAC.1